MTPFMEMRRLRAKGVPLGQDNHTTGNPQKL